MTDSIVEKIARAVLYEGYLLYPYRRSSLKNRQPWSFGTLLPQSWAESNGQPFRMQAQCLATTTAQTSINSSVRFLQLNRNGEAVERRVVLPDAAVSDLLNGIAVPFAFGGNEISGGKVASDPAGLRSINGLLEVSAHRLCDSLIKLNLCVTNTTALNADVGSDEALPQALAAAHVVLGISNGEFVSLLDPPEALRQAAETCVHVGAFPVMVGEAGERGTILISPIILYDYPQIAPESPGDFFDATEIDEMLSLRVLTLTDEEKREMRASGEHARAILERTEALPPEEWAKIHGALRGLHRSEEQQ